MARKKLGEIMIRTGTITDRDLSSALERQAGRDRGRRVGELLVAAGAAGEEALAAALACQLHLPSIDLSAVSVEPSVLKIVPQELAERHNVLPLGLERRLRLAVSDPLDLAAIDDVRFAAGREVELFVAPAGELRSAIDQYYHLGQAVEGLVGRVVRKADLELIEEKGVQPGACEREEVAGAVPDEKAAPVIRLVNLIITEAVSRRASDIHLEPQRKFLRVRIRVDGRLQERMQLPKFLQGAVVSRIKVMAGMDIAKKRSPQDGGIKVKVGERDIDLRISTLPTHFGEKVVIRILDREAALIGLEAVGLEGEALAAVESFLRRPHGMILVTGPTGSGKSTTLHAALRTLLSEDTNIIAVEDPVEYEIPGVSQVQVLKEAGLTFASALRSILRQDPDVVMIGEIRDLETAEIAFKASLTGHLVLSTLHTNDTAATITRLYDLGVEPYLIGGALIGIVAQRLVRLNCPACAAPYDPGADLMEDLGIEPGRAHVLRRGRGCEACDSTGFRGRMGIFEVMRVTSRLRSLISTGSSEQEIREAALAEGLRPLSEDGVRRALAGQTALEEVLYSAGAGAEGSPVRPECGTSDSRDDGEPAGRPRLLIVDDEPAIQLTVKLALRGLDCDVETAGNGLEAVEAVRRRLPTLIISDVNMPRMDGLALCRTLRSEVDTAFIPFIMLTSRDSAEDKLAGFAHGTDDYITKPFDHRELKARVQRLLDRVHG